MTLDQFLGACLGLALVALTRLVDRWLPATEDQPAAAPAPVAPRAVDLDIIEPPDEP